MRDLSLLFRRIALAAGIPASLLLLPGCETCSEYDGSRCLAWEGEADTCPSREGAREMLAVDEVVSDATYVPARTYDIEGRAYSEPAECCYEVRGEACHTSEMRGFGRVSCALTRRATRRARGAGRARLWSLRGALEHASIAEHARFASELARLGAPDTLVRDVRRAAADEAVHAELCFSLAASHGATAPRPTRPRRVRAAHGAHGGARRLAQRLVDDACVGETLGVAAREAELLRTRDPATRAVLVRIAGDEARHAALAFRALGWLAESGLVPRWELVALVEKSPAAAADPRVFQEVVLPCARLVLAGLAS